MTRRCEPVETLDAHRAAARQRGMSLMEILLVIAIVAFLIVGGLTLFIQAQNQGQSQRAQQQLTNLAASIRSVYSGSPSYDGLTTQILYQTNAVPEDMMMEDENTILNAFGGPVTLSEGTQCGGTTDGEFCITFENLPQTACQQLATARIGFVGVAGAQGGGAQAVNADNAPLTVPQAAQICTDDNMDLTFRFAG